MIMSDWEAIVEWTGAKKWTSYHNYKYDVDDIGNLFNPDEISTGGDVIRGYNATTDLIKSLIADRVAANNGAIRAVGSGWSFSDAPATKGRLLNTLNLNLTFTVSENHVGPDYAGKVEDLYFAQCGAKIWHITERLEARGRSLKVSGASNGQTIAGAISTGTHGAAIDGGAVQDQVVGLHVVTGADRHVWIERSSYPIVTDAFLQRINAELIRDDRLFYSALVSFGSFGFIHGVMLETEPIFLLSRFSYLKPFDENMKNALTTLDLSELRLPHGSERPYHFAAIINPHKPNWGAYITVMYKQKLDPTYVKPDPRKSGHGAGDDLAAFLAFLTDRDPDLTPTLVNAAFPRRYPGREGRPSFARGTLGDMFNFTTPVGDVASMAMGVAIPDVMRTLDVIFELNRQTPFPGGVGLRYVKGTKALLGFTKFDPTCVIELDGVRSRTADRFYELVWQQLEENGIPYTLHWGKVNHQLNAERIRLAYGTNVNDWLFSRAHLLEDTSRRIFASESLQQNGLLA
jgi:FAD/FMN-containing dehydrogenase